MQPVFRIIVRDGAAVGQNQAAAFCLCDRAENLIFDFRLAAVCQGAAFGQPAHQAFIGQRQRFAQVRAGQAVAPAYGLDWVIDKILKVDLVALLVGIGVYVNDDTSATSQWTTAGSGYHIDYQRADAVVYEKGTAYYERGNTVVYQRGYHQYERNSNVSYQYATSGIAWERKSGNNWVSARNGYSSTSSQARNYYSAYNTTPDESDGWRARVTGSLGGKSGN